MIFEEHTVSLWAYATAPLGYSKEVQKLEQSYHKESQFGMRTENPQDVAIKLIMVGKPKRVTILSVFEYNLRVNPMRVFQLTSLDQQR